MTNGKSGAHNSRIQAEIKRLQQKHVIVYAIGIGQNVNYNELLAIAGNDRMFQLGSSTEMLGSLVNSIKQFCRSKK